VDSVTASPYDDRWPIAPLTNIIRARALAAAMPGTWREERVIAASFEAVWRYVSDLERSVPEFDGDVSAVRITRRQGTRLRLRANASWKFLWLPLWLDVTLEPGWCLMRSRPQAYVIVMAAEPVGPQATRFVHVEGIAVPSRLAMAFRPALALSRWRHRHHVPKDVSNIERRLTRGGNDPA
jgi:hypothetical protein